MDRGALSFFEPFERLPANHENQLTRARCSCFGSRPWLMRTEVFGRRCDQLQSIAERVSVQDLLDTRQQIHDTVPRKAQLENGVQSLGKRRFLVCCQHI